MKDWRCPLNLGTPEGVTSADIGNMKGSHLHPREDGKHFTYIFLAPPATISMLTLIKLEDARLLDLIGTSTGHSFESS